MKKAFIASLILSVSLAVSAFAARDYSDPAVIKEVQEALNAAGYDCGTPDGIAGAMTGTAVSAYRNANSLPDGTDIDEELYNSLFPQTEDKEESPQTEGDEEPETILDFVDKSDGSFLRGLTVTAKQVEGIYKFIEARLTSDDYPLDDEEADRYDEETWQLCSEEFGFPVESIKNIYGYASWYGIPGTNTDITLLHGELVDTKFNGMTLIVKAKIQPSYSDKATVDQNFYNVCDIIRNQGGSAWDEIQYWAVADMTNGKEEKVVSFSVKKDLIDIISTQKFADNKLADYLDDLWVHQSLNYPVSTGSSKTDSGSSSDIDAYIDLMKLSLADSYGNDYRVTREGKTVSCSVWRDGIGDGVLYAILGYEDLIDSYNSMREGQASAARAYYDYLAQIDKDANLLYSVLDDTDEDTVILSWYNGVLIYDILSVD